MGKVKVRRGTGGVKKQCNDHQDKSRNNVKKEKKKKTHTWRSVREKNRTRIDKKETVQKHEQQDTRAHSSSSQASLRTRMLEKLSIARFRTVNADMDSSSSARKSKADNPLLSKLTFESYHSGFTSASNLWKQNPLDLIAAWIRRSVPKDHVVADFGCGAGKLAKSVTNVTHSFDLHRLEGNDHVVECDMRNVPLPDKSVHVAVFCLSLMGSDVTEFILEARRVLVDNGVLKIAEAAARLSGDNMRKFCTGMHSIGFKKTGVQEIGGGSTNTHVFVVMEFRKTGGNVKTGKKPQVVLGACVYKKR